MSNSSSSFIDFKQLPKRTYNKVLPESKAALIHEVFQNHRSVSKSAQMLGIKLSTAKVVIKKHKHELAKLKDRELVHQINKQIADQKEYIMVSTATCTPQIESIPIPNMLFCYYDPECIFGRDIAYVYQPYTNFFQIL